MPFSKKPYKSFQGASRGVWKQSSFAGKKARGSPPQVKGYMQFASKAQKAPVAKGTCVPRAVKPWPERRPLAKSGAWPQKQQRYRPVNRPERFVGGTTLGEFADQFSEGE